MIAVPYGPIMEVAPNHFYLHTQPSWLCFTVCVYKTSRAERSEDWGSPAAAYSYLALRKYTLTCPWMEEWTEKSLLTNNNILRYWCLDHFSNKMIVEITGGRPLQNKSVNPGGWPRDLRARDFYNHTWQKVKGRFGSRARSPDFHMASLLPPSAPKSTFLFPSSYGVTSTCGSNIFNTNPGKFTTLLFFLCKIYWHSLQFHVWWESLFVCAWGSVFVVGRASLKEQNSSIDGQSCHSRILGLITFSQLLGYFLNCVQMHRLFYCINLSEVLKADIKCRIEKWAWAQHLFPVILKGKKMQYWTALYTRSPVQWLQDSLN